MLDSVLNIGRTKWLTSLSDLSQLADITLASWAQASVRLSVRIVPMVQFSHSLPLPNDPIWYYTIGVGAVILVFHF